MTMCKTKKIRFITYISPHVQKLFEHESHQFSVLELSMRALDYIRNNKGQLMDIADNSGRRVKSSYGKTIYPYLQCIPKYQEEFDFFCMHKMYSDIREVVGNAYYGIPFDLSPYLHKDSLRQYKTKQDINQFIALCEKEKKYPFEKIYRLLCDDLTLLRTGEISQKEAMFDWYNEDFRNIPFTIATKAPLFEMFNKFLAENGLPQERGEIV